MKTSTLTPSRKPVLIRFPESMLEAIKAHQALMSATMGPVHFTQAVMHLVQASLDAASAPAESN